MWSALIVDAVVLVAVLQSDIGRHRKIDKFRLLRPVLVAAGIVPIFMEAVTTHGNGLTLEVALAVSGIILGAIATCLMKVFRSPDTHKPVSRAGSGYAALWIVFIGARALFTYGSDHWFGSQLGHWMLSNDITSEAIVDGLIFMAVTMILTRTITIATRARHLPAPTTTSSATALQAA